MKILLAVKDTNLRLSLELVLSEEPSVDIAGTASEADGLSALIKSNQPAIVILDWNLPGRPLSAVIAETHRRLAAVKFIALGSSPADKEQALADGANAFIVKGDPPELLLTAFRAIRRQIQTTPIDRSSNNEKLANR